MAGFFPGEKRSYIVFTPYWACPQLLRGGRGGGGGHVCPALFWWTCVRLLSLAFQTSELEQPSIGAISWRSRMHETVANWGAIPTRYHIVQAQSHLSSQVWWRSSRRKLS